MTAGAGAAAVLAAAVIVSGQPAYVLADCQRRAEPGQVVCVCGTFPDRQDGGAVLMLDGGPARVVYWSRSLVRIQLPAEIALGRHALTLVASRQIGRLEIEVVRATIALAPARLRRGQSGRATVIVEGTDEPVPMVLSNEAPAIASLAPSDRQEVETSGGTANQVERRYRALARGEFLIRAELRLPPCPCGAPSTTDAPPGPGGVGVIIDDPGPIGAPPAPPVGRLGILLTRDDDNWIPALMNDASCPAPAVGSPTTTVTARLYEFDGARWVTTSQRRQITTRFTSRSTEPGRALNMAASMGPEDAPDLHLSALFNPRHECDDDPTGVGYFFGRCRTRELVSETTVTVFANDAGGVGRLTAECSDCLNLRAGEAGLEVAVAPASWSVAVPKDDNGNRIADAYPTDGRRPDEDVDAKPASRFEGDGLSVFEEYRGFFTLGCHVRTDPDVKDVFVENEPGFDTSLFAEASGVALWQIRRGEHRQRVLNFNRAFATRVAQHALILADRQCPTAPESAGCAPLGPPRRVDFVAIERRRIASIPGTPERLVVAHELGHAVGIVHHGRRDIEDLLVLRGTGFASDPAQPPVTVQRDLPELCGKQLSRIEPAKFRLGHRQDQGSGDLLCIMAYARFGEIVRDDAAPGGFACLAPFDLTEQKGLCVLPAGTLRNAGDRAQGHAAVGNCRGQLHVSDAQ